MASITYDGQSFMIDGRRIWIVAGAIHYARVPRAAWAQRIQAAKAAGLNTISTPVFWARHEPRQGQFDFTGDNDLRHFVQLIHQHGMYCILRPGPFVNSAWDLGGLPSWLLSVPNVRLRTANAPFLEASSRYITAVAQQVRDLQVTSPGEGGPILLVQNEHAWTCGHDELATQYLGELSRYYRESGLTVPIINANDLWQGIESEIECWSGEANMLADLRQLAAVRPDQPRLVIDFRTGHPDVWGQPPHKPLAPSVLLRRLAEVLAGAGQYNLSPFHGGTNFGFSAGRLPTAPDAFVATSHDCGAPLSETGQPTPAYDAVKRISTFASRFGRVLANLDPKRHGVVPHPVTPSASPAGGRGGSGASPAVVVHVPGSQGSVAFVFGDEGATGRAAAGAGVNLLLPDGSTLPVPLAGLGVAWCLFDTRLTGRTTLDYCNLSAFAAVGRTFVCYGPAGARAQLSINGSRLEVDVPGGQDPAVVEHEGIAVVVCSTEQADAAFADDDGVYVGLAALERGASGGASPVPHPDFKHYTRVSASGEVTTHKIGSAKGSTPARKRSREGSRVALGNWSAAPAADYADGTSARYASIAGPADLDSLGAPSGYGWYRIRMRSAPGGRHKVMLTGARDRVQMILDGEPAGVAGLGPGAQPLGALTLRKGPHTLVCLAENFGRPAGGLNLAQRAGMTGHVWAVAAMKVKAPRPEPGNPVDAMAVHAPFWHLHRGETTEAVRLTWTFQHRRKTPVFVCFGDLGGCRGVLLLNDQPLGVFDSAGLAPMTLPAETLSRGNNTFQMALLGPPGTAAAKAAALGHAVSFYEGEECLTDEGSAEWAFAKWEPPTPDAFGRGGQAAAGTPTWWSCHFMPDQSEAPLVLDLAGMTKGQVYINGRHLCRYFVATGSGESVPTQQRYVVPRSMVPAGEPSELMLFDEHGASPSKATLTSVH